MTEIVISVDGECVDQLTTSFEQGPMLNAAGLRFLTEEQVAKVGGLKISIFADEHPPPHFGDYFQGEHASFAIDDCTRLRGNKGLERFEWNIRNRWKGYRGLLIERWNATRPTDCPVGPVKDD